MRTVRFAYVIFVRITRFSHQRAIPIRLTRSALLARVRLLRHALPISLQILRKKNSTVLQFTNDKELRPDIRKNRQKK